MNHPHDPATPINTALTSVDTTSVEAHEPSGSRPCPSCGDRFTPHPRKPSQTYCSERCRGAAYRRRRARHPVTSSNLTRNHEVHEDHDVRAVTDTRNEVVARHEVHHDVDEVNHEVNAVQHCPHCRQPVVLVTLITTPAAAHVTIPPPPATTITSSGYHPAAGATPSGGADEPHQRISLQPGAGPRAMPGPPRLPHPAMRPLALPAHLPPAAQPARPTPPLLPPGLPSRRAPPTPHVITRAADLAATPRNWQPQHARG